VGEGASVGVGAGVSVGLGAGGGVGAATVAAGVGEVSPPMTTTVAVASGALVDSVPGGSHAASAITATKATVRMIVHRKREIEITTHPSWDIHKV